MRRNIRHLLLLIGAVGIVGMGSVAGVMPASAQQLRFRNEGLPDANRRAAAAVPGSTSGLAPAQFQELAPAVPDAVSEADLPNPSAAAQTEGGAQIAEDAGAEEVLEATDIHDQWLAEEEGGFVQHDADAALFFSSNSAFRRGYWYSQQDFVSLLRSEMQDLLIAVDSFNSTIASTEDMSIGDVGFSYEPGLRFTLGRFLGQDVANRDNALEVSFFGLFSYSGTADIQSAIGSEIDTVLGPGLPFVGGGPTLPVAGFSDAFRQTIDYDSDFNSIELNYRIMGRPRRDRLALQPSGAWIRHATPSKIRSGYIGARYMKLNDFFQYRSFFLNPDLDAGAYNLNIHNDLLGVNLGGSVTEHYSCWSWGVHFKTSGLINFVNRRSSIATLINGFSFDRSESISDEHLAVLVEAGAKASYQVKPNFIVNLGYDFMYLTGISTASHNLDLAPHFPKLDLTGDVFFHGLSVGAEMLW